MNLNPQMLLQMLPALKGNATQFMQQYGIMPPQGANMNDAQSIANSLASSGVVDQNTLNFAQNFARQMGYKL